MKHMKYSGLVAAAMVAMAGAAQAEVTLTVLIDNAPNTVAQWEGISAAFTAANPDIVLELETRPGGGEGDNIVKTRLATGEMTDVFAYNSGSLFQAINPEANLLDLSDLESQANVLDSFKPTVSAGGKVYGVPVGSAMGGGIFYHRPTYEELGLSVPKTWAEFMENNAKIKEAGKAAVGGTFGATWTSQLFVLADYFNVQAQVPDFADKYTANEIKYASTPAAVRGFEHLQEVYEAGVMNADYGAATFEEGVAMVATGDVVHYPMLTFAIGAIAQNNPDELNDVGFFAQPGDDPNSNGLTVWMPGGVYMPKTAQNVEEGKKLLNFIASVAGCDAQTEANGFQGPYLVKGCDAPADVVPAVSDMMPYFEADGRTAPALEFLSPVKGPALEQITVEVGSGIRSAADGAALYDQDVEKQAKQLGLPNW